MHHPPKTLCQAATACNKFVASLLEEIAWLAQSFCHVLNLRSIWFNCFEWSTLIIVFHNQNESIHVVQCPIIFQSQEVWPGKEHLHSSSLPALISIYEIKICRFTCLIHPINLLLFAANFCRLWWGSSNLSVFIALAAPKPPCHLNSEIAWHPPIIAKRGSNSFVMQSKSTGHKITSVDHLPRGSSTFVCIVQL